MRLTLAVAVAALLTACASEPVEAGLPPTTTTTTPAAPDPAAPPTTTIVYLGPRATFVAAGRTLEVKPSDRRKPYGELGNQLPIPQHIQVDLGAPGAGAADGFVIPREEWDAGATGTAMEIVSSGEEHRFIWQAVLAPGEYGLEVTFDLAGAPVTVRAPVQVVAE